MEDRPISAVHSSASSIKAARHVSNRGAPLCNFNGFQGEILLTAAAAAADSLLLFDRREGAKIVALVGC